MQPLYTQLLLSLTASATRTCRENHLSTHMPKILDGCARRQLYCVTTESVTGRPSPTHMPKVCTTL